MFLELSEEGIDSSEAAPNVIVLDTVSLIDLNAAGENAVTLVFVTNNERSIGRQLKVRRKDCDMLLENFFAIYEALIDCSILFRPLPQSGA
jgi:hypothetical protein